MLFIKLFRDIKRNFMQFLSIFILAFLAVYVFAGMASSNVGIKQIRSDYHEDTNLADAWVYGDGFTEEELEAVRSIDEVTGAQLRKMIEVKGQEESNPKIELYLETENLITKPYLIEGVEFDPEDQDGLWLNNRFAEENQIQVGDSYTFTYNGLSVTKEVKGLIMSPEYEYYMDSTDLEPDFAKMGYAYMGRDAFPIRDYARTILLNGTISISDILAYTTALQSTVDQLESMGMTQDQILTMITPEMVVDKIDQMSEEQLWSIAPMSQMVVTTNQSDVTGLEEKISDAIDQDYAVFLDQSSQSGIKQLSDEIDQHDQFAIVFPVAFLIIALLVIVTTMNRIVTEQRIQIGTMKALGVKRWKILLHYCSYSFLLSALGALVGLLTGPATIGEIMNYAMPSIYTLPEWKAGYSNQFYMIVILTILVCTMATYISCRKVLKINPADTLRPAAPRAGKTCIFEHLPFWNRLSFSSQYNLRDLSRSKLRAFMCVFGTMCGMMLMVCGIGCNDSLTNVDDWEFIKLQNYTTQILFKDQTSVEDAENLRDEVSGELVMMSAIEISDRANATSEHKSTTSIVVTEGKGIYGVTDVSQNVIDLKGSDIAITRKLAEQYGLKVGDTVYWHLYDQEEWTESTITYINRNPMITGITMSREAYEKTGFTYTPYECVTNQDNVDLHYDYISIIHNKQDIQDAFHTSMQILYLLVAMFITFALILNIVVLYNSGILSFNERVKEFATLKVLGFQTTQIRRLLFQQNLWLSIIGVVIGAPFGRMLLQYLFDSNGDSMDFLAVVSVPSYLLCGFTVVICSILVSWMFSKRVKKLDMVEVLKGLE